jgi:hypothetical protein
LISSKEQVLPVKAQHVHTLKKIGGCWSWEPPVSSSGIMVMGFASLLRVSSSIDIVTWLAINYQPQHTGIANLYRPCHPGNQIRTGVFCFHFSGCPHPRTKIHTRVIILTSQHEQLGAQPQLDTINVSSDMTPVMHDWISDQILAIALANLRCLRSTRP